MKIEMSPVRCGLLSLLLCSLSSVVLSAPALVWKNDFNSPTVHHSEDVSFEDVMRDTFSSGEGNRLNVVFLLGRNDQNGEETLSSWTLSGALPGVAKKSDSAFCVQHHVSNVQNAQAVVGMANRARDGKGGNAVKVSLDEFSHMINTMEGSLVEDPVATSNAVVPQASSKMSTKRSRALKQATILIVDVPVHSGPAALDNAVIRATESKDYVSTVILTSVRSVSEVKLERDQRVLYRRALMEEEGQKMNLASRDGNNDRRRLQDASDVTGIYYVSMTPNIFSGLLFFFFFTIVTMIGISCMGMIQGQDVYVTKMPSVGREF